MTPIGVIRHPQVSLAPAFCSASSRFPACFSPVDESVVVDYN